MSIITSPGKIIIEYLQEYGIDVGVFMESVNFSPKQLEEFIEGRIELSETIINVIEKLIPNIPSNYWINMGSKYREYIEEKYKDLDLNEKELKSIAKRFRFSEVFSGLGWDLKRQALEMLNLLNINTFEDFNTQYANLAVNFMEDGGELESIAIWLRQCEEEVLIQNSDLVDIQYNSQDLTRSLWKFKKLALMENNKGITVNCRKLLNDLGIYFVINETVTNSKVRGAITTYEDRPAIFISGRFKTHDHIWFALLHEIGHLILHYDSNKSIISMESEKESDAEKEASDFARDFFVNPREYSKFVHQDDFNKGTIRRFAKNQGVLPGIIVGQLQHDGLIKMNSFNDLKIRYSTISF